LHAKGFDSEFSSCDLSSLIGGVREAVGSEERVVNNGQITTMGLIARGRGISPNPAINHFIDKPNIPTAHNTTTTTTVNSTIAS